MRIATSAALVTPLLAFEHEPTHPVSEGPAYKPGAPFRRDLISPGSPGKRFVLRGKVYSSASDKPIAQATLDLWNVQNNAKYDFEGFNLRGRQLSTPKGEFEFLTLEAIPYDGRTAHFHIKVSAPGFQPLTTELYLPDLTQNSRDGAFRTSNLLRVMNDSGIRKGDYEFYLRPL